MSENLKSIATRYTSILTSQVALNEGCPPSFLPYAPNGEAGLAYNVVGRFLEDLRHCEYVVVTDNFFQALAFFWICWHKASMLFELLEEIELEL